MRMYGCSFPAAVQRKISSRTTALFLPACLSEKPIPVFVSPSRSKKYAARCLPWIFLQLLVISHDEDARTVIDKRAESLAANRFERTPARRFPNILGYNQSSRFRSLGTRSSSTEVFVPLDLPRCNALSTNESSIDEMKPERATE